MQHQRTQSKAATEELIRWARDGDGAAARGARSKPSARPGGGARWWCWSREIEAGGATGSWVVLVDHKIETDSMDCEIDFRWW